MHLVRRGALLFILSFVISYICADPITAITATNGGQIILCAYQGDSNITCTQIGGPPPISTSFSSASSTKAVIPSVATTSKSVTSLDSYSNPSRTTNSTNTPVTVYLNSTSSPISNITTSNTTVSGCSSAAVPCNNTASSNSTRLSTTWTPATASLNNTSSSGAPYLNATSSTSPATSTMKSIAPVPTVPGPYGPGNWSTLTCSPELTGNTGLSNDEMWAAADADGAWKYVSTLPYDGSINWSSFVARALNLSSWQEYQCHELSVNNVCMYQQQCGAPITPAAWMIINSIANLWGYHWDIWNLIAAARASIDVDLIVYNFSPQFDVAAYLQHEIFLTGLTFGIMMGIGAIFSFGAELLMALTESVAIAAEVAAEDAIMIALRKALEGPNTIASYAETEANIAKRTAQLARNEKITKGLKTASILLAHDTLAGVVMYEILTSRYADGTAETGLAAQNVLTDLISNTTNRWQTAQSIFVSEIFNGSAASIANVGAAIANGTWLTPWNETQTSSNFSTGALGKLQKNLYAQMIPYAWAAATKSKDQIMPVIIMGDGCLTDIKQIITTNSPYGPPMQFDKDVNDVRFCFESHTFWLLMPYKTGHGSSAVGQIEGTDQVRYSIPPGLKMLNGSLDVAAGLAYQDIYIASYYGWTNNSKMNPTIKPSAIEMAGNGSWAWDQGVQYPAFFNYAICVGLFGAVAAAQSWWDKSYVDPC